MYAMHRCARMRASCLVRSALCVSARWQSNNSSSDNSTGSTSSTPPSCAATDTATTAARNSSNNNSSSDDTDNSRTRHDARVVSNDDSADAASVTSTPPSHNNSSSSSISPREMLAAVRRGNLAAAQSHASALVQQRWRDEYSVRVACVLVLLVTWYWAAAARRSTRRRCAAVQAALRHEADETVDAVRRTTERWASELTRTHVLMQNILDKNSALTADVDRLTTALRSCMVPPPPPSLSSRTRRAREHAYRGASDATAAPTAAAAALGPSAAGTTTATMTAAAPAAATTPRPDMRSARGNAAQPQQQRDGHDDTSAASPAATAVSLSDEQTQTRHNTTTVTTSYAEEDSSVLVCLSQLFVLTLRGEVLVWRRYRNDAPHDAPSLFYRAYTHGGLDDSSSSSSSYTGGGGSAMACASYDDAAATMTTAATSAAAATVMGGSAHAPPCFRVGRVHYAHLRLSSLLLVAATAHEVSPSGVLGLLARLAALLRDYVGVLTEARLRRSLALVYDVCEEAMGASACGGVAQELNTEQLRPYVAHDAAAADTAYAHGSSDSAAAAAASDATLSGVLRGDDAAASHSLLQSIQRLDTTEHTQRGEAAMAPVLLARHISSGDGSSSSGGGGSVVGSEAVYVDVCEQLHVVCDARGALVVANVSGRVVVKSYAQSAPTLSLLLNKTLCAACDDEGSGGGSGDCRGVVNNNNSASTSSARMIVSGLWIDDGDDVDVSRFARDGALAVRATLGERVVLRYHVTSPPPATAATAAAAAAFTSSSSLSTSTAAAASLALPFGVTHSLEVRSPQHAELLLCLRAHMAADVAAVSVRVHVALPHCTNNATGVLAAAAAGQTVVYDEAAHAVCWHLPQVSGGAQHRCTVHITTSAPFTPALRRRVGPVWLCFDIPQYTATGLRVQTLRVHERNNNNNNSSGSGGYGAEVGHRTCRRWLRHMTEGVDCVYRTQG